MPGNGVDDDGNGYIDDVYGWNFYSGSNQVYTGSEDSNGTHGAGTIAAHADNGIGIAGIVRSDHVKVMAVKALGGWDGSGSTASIIRAIQYAEANGARICNLSLGSSRNDPALYRTIAASDMLFVVAAGNDGADLELAPSYPASYHLDNLITVANLRYDGNLDPTSSYGASSVDLAAPGTHILSTTPGNSYSYMTGTSMAAPMVSAAATMLYSQFPDATLADVKDILLYSVAKAGQPHRPDGYRRDAGPGCRHGIRGRGPEGADLDGAGPGGLYRQSAHSLPVSLPVEGAAVSDRSSPGSGRRLPLRRLCRRDIHGSEFPGRRRGDAPPLECVGGRHLAGAQWRTLYLLRGGPGRQ
nr:S8 family peptidase [Oscillibacter sp.]